MFCNKCGAAFSDSFNVCPNCGNVVSGNQNQSYYNNQNGYQNNYQQGQYYHPPQYNNMPYNAPQYQPYNFEQATINDEISSANTLGIVALVCVLLIPSVGSLVGFILGIIGLSKANHALSSPYGASNPTARSAKKMNLAAIWIPVIETIIIIVLWLFVIFGIMASVPFFSAFV